MMTYLDKAAPYLPALSAIESAHALPENLLVRVAFQECSFRPEVISGAVKSSAGAVGMFQLMPQFFPGAGVSWEADASRAANFLTSLYKLFKDWQCAIAAYNWGPANVSAYLEGKKQVMPLETENYVRDVCADVPLVGKLIDIATIGVPA